MIKGSVMKRSRLNWTAFALLVLAISVPVFAICFFLYAGLEEIGEEITTLARVYGKFLYKEHLTNHLVRMAKDLDTLQNGGVAPASQRDSFPDLEQLLKTSFCAELDQHLIVVNTKTAEILYPVTWQKSRFEFLQDKVRKDEFMRMIRAADPERPAQGYLFENAADGDPSHSGNWYVSTVPSGKDFMFVSMVAENEISVAGDTLEAAQQELIKAKGRRFLIWAVLVGLASALLIGYIFCAIETKRRDVVAEGPHEPYG